MLARVNYYLQSSFKHISELMTGNKSYNRGGRYRQVSLYMGKQITWHRSLGTHNTNTTKQSTTIARAYFTGHTLLGGKIIIWRGATYIRLHALTDSGDVFAKNLIRFNAILLFTIFRNNKLDTIYLTTQQISMVHFFLDFHRDIRCSGRSVGWTVSNSNSLKIPIL